MQITEKLYEALGMSEDDIPAHIGGYDTDFDVVDYLNDKDVDDGLIVRRTGEKQVSVGYLVYDTEVRDYFSDSDGLGELHVFRSEDDRDAFVDQMTEEGREPLIAENYRHGQEHWSVAGTRNYPDRQWDVAPRGVYLPDTDLIEQVKKEDKDPQAIRKKLVADANSVLNEYSKSINGEVYGVVVETWDFDEQSKGFVQGETDSCWGYIGTEHSIEALRNTMPETFQDASLDI